MIKIGFLCKLTGVIKNQLINMFISEECLKQGEKSINLLHFIHFDFFPTIMNESETLLI